MAAELAHIINRPSPHNLQSQKNLEPQKDFEITIECFISPFAIIA